MEKVPKDIHGEKSRKFEKTGLNNWSMRKSDKGTEPDVRKGKRSLLACHTRCKCSIEETTRNAGRLRSVSR